MFKSSPNSITTPQPRRDPDNVVLCLLAADEDDDRDVALQIHFTLIQAFCCENDINIMRVSNPGRLAQLLLLEPNASPANEGAQQPPDLHCVLVTVSQVRDSGTCCRRRLERVRELVQSGNLEGGRLDFQPRDDGLVSSWVFTGDRTCLSTLQGCQQRKRSRESALCF